MSAEYKLGNPLVVADSHELRVSVGAFRPVQRPAYDDDLARLLTGKDAWTI